MDRANPPATAHLLRRLGEERVVTPAQARTLEQLLREHLPWRLWAERVLLAVGSSLVLAGVIFFFAYNWKDLSPPMKFGVVEFGLVLCAVGAWWAGLDELGGKIGLAAASVLTGVFLAVHGQVYQTGADSWTLFAAWAALILPWAILARFATLWMLWLALVNTAVALWWTTSFQNLDLQLLALVAGLNGAALALREVGVIRGFTWLDEDWVRAVLLLGIFALLTGGTWDVLETWHGFPRQPLVPVMLVVFLLLGYWVYRLRLPSVAALSVIVLSTCTLLVVVIRKCLSQLEHFDSGVWLLLIFVTLAVYGSGVVWLRALHRRLSAGPAETAVS